jgi:hypothetical protein
MLFRHSGWLSEEKLFSAICFPLRFYTAKTRSGLWPPAEDLQEQTAFCPSVKLS